MISTSTPDEAEGPKAGGEPGGTNQDESQDLPEMKITKDKSADSLGGLADDDDDDGDGDDFDDSGKLGTKFEESKESQGLGHFVPSFQRQKPYPN
jgi:hypothetical protein